MHRHLPRLLAAIAVSWMPIGAMAQAPQRSPKPYTPVAIERPAGLDDAGFIAFRAALAAAAKTRIYAELAPLVISQRFFWDRDFSRHFDPRRPAVDNLAAAISLEQGNGAGWATLAALAGDASAEPLESRPGVICAPARPGYDSLAFSRLLDATYTGEIDWAYPRDDETPVRTAAQPDAGQLGMLGAHFVRVLGLEGTDGGPPPGHNRWTHVVLPNGKSGYVTPGRLMSLGGARLCYIKDMVAGWRVAGIIAAETGPGSAKSGSAK